MSYFFRRTLLFLLLSAEPLLASTLGKAYEAFSSGKFEEAEAAFRRHLEDNPRDWSQLYNTGVSLYQQGKFEEARSLFEQSRQSPDPSLKSRAAYNQGMAEIMLKRLDQAEQSLQDALSYDNTNTMISENLAWVREQRDKKQKQKQEDPSQPQSPGQNSAQNQDQNQNQDQEQKQNKSENQSADQNGQAGENQQQTADNQKGPSEEPQKGQKPGEEKADAQQDESQNLNQGQGQGQKQDKAQAQSGAEAQSDPSSARAENQGEGAQAGRSDETPAAHPKDSSKEMPRLSQETATAAQSEGEQGKDQAGGSVKGRILSEKDLERQQAEKILRTIEDKIGRYPLTEGAAQKQKGANEDGKAW